LNPENTSVGDDGLDNTENPTIGNFVNDRDQD